MKVFKLTNWLTNEQKEKNEPDLINQQKDIVNHNHTTPALLTQKLKCSIWN